MSFRTFTTTTYGNVSADSLTVGADSTQLHAWATRPGASWPCSELKRLDYIRATFEPNGDLVALNSNPDDTPNLSADELTAWADDVRTLARLEYLRSQLDAECISQGELIELQGLAEHIDPSDVQLLEAAGVPEFADS